MHERRWQQGETIMLRFPPEDRMVRAYFANGGTAGFHVLGWPHIVLEDSDQRIALYMPEGTPLERFNLDEQRVRQSRVSQGDSVRLFLPGQPFEVSLYYETGSGPAPWVRVYWPDAEPRRFYGWKVDISSPFVRTAVGFDTIDEVLDIAVAPDRSYQIRDADELARLVELGIYNADEAARLHDVTRQAIALIEAGAPPFDGEWPGWRPDPALTLSEVSPAWRHLPVPPPYRTYRET